MNDKTDKKENQDKTSRACQRCGAPEAKPFGDDWLCRDCFQLCGSCCLEFGGDDLWKEKEQENERT